MEGFGSVVFLFVVVFCVLVGDFKSNFSYHSPPSSQLTSESTDLCAVLQCSSVSGGGGGGRKAVIAQ